METRSSRVSTDCKDSRIARNEVTLFIQDSATTPRVDGDQISVLMGDPELTSYLACVLFQC